VEFYFTASGMTIWLISKDFNSLLKSLMLSNFLYYLLPYYIVWSPYVPHFFRIKLLQNCTWRFILLLVLWPCVDTE